MRKFFLNFMTVVLATSLVMVSCDQKPDVDDPNKDQNQTENPDNGGNTTPTTPVDWEKEGYTRMTSAEGYAVTAQGYIDLILANETDTLVAMFWTEGDEQLSKGEYEVNTEDSPNPGTWESAYTTLITEDSEVYVVDGTISVKKSGRNYTVSTNCTDENGNPVKYVYEGAIELEVITAYPYTGENLNYGVAYYVGNTTVGDGMYIIDLLSLTEEDEAAEAVEMYLIGTGAGSATELPTGTFTVAETGESNTIVRASVEDGAPIYSWIYGGFDGTYYNDLWALYNGTLVITKNEDDTYTLEAEMFDGYMGQDVSFSYTGAITIYDESTAATASVKSVKANKANKNVKLNRRALRIRK